MTSSQTAAPSLQQARFGAFYPWYVTILLSLAHLVSLVDRHLMGIALVDIKAEFGLSDTQLGFLYGTGFAILYSLVSIPLGRIADRSNRRNLIAAGLLVWTTATALTAFAGGLTSLTILRMAVGLGEACLIPAGMSLLVALVPKPMLARATAVFAIGGGVGLAIALLAGGPLLGLFHSWGGITALGAEITPWRSLFLIVSLLGIPLLLLLLFIREPARSLPADDGGLKAVLQAMRPRAMGYFLHFAAYTCFATMAWAVWAWGLSVFIREYDMTSAGAGTMMGALVLVVAPLGTFAGGWVLDRLRGRGIVGATGMMIGASGIVALPFALMFGLSASFGWSFAALAVLLVIVFFTTTPGYLGAQLLAPPAIRGMVMALFVAFYSGVSLGLGPLIVGLASDFIFEGEGGLRQALSASLALLASAGVTLGLLSRRHARRHNAEVIE